MADSVEAIRGWAQVPPQAFVLRASKDGRVVDTLDLSKRSHVVLGRSSQLADVVLDHASLSRQHCVLAYDPSLAAFCVVDLQSSHGTFVNGARLAPFKRRQLVPSDSVTVGASSRAYHVVTDGVAAAAAAVHASSDARAAAGPPPAAAPDSQPAVAATAAASLAASTRAQREAEIAAMVASLNAAPAPGGTAAEGCAAAEDGDDGGLEGAAAAAGGSSVTSAPPPLRPSAAFFRGVHSGRAVGGGPEAPSSSSAEPLPSHSDAPSSSPVVAGDVDGEDDGEKEVEDEFAAVGLPAGFGSRKLRQSNLQAAARRAAGDAAEVALVKRAAVEIARRGGGGLPAAEADGGEPHGAFSVGGGGGGAGEDGYPTGSVEAAAAALKLPVSHEAVLGTQKGKTVTSLAFDASGARVACGSSDYTVRLYDFGSMDRAHKPYKEIVPHDGQPVHSLAYSPTGDRLLVTTGGAKARVFDREGAPLVTTIKGDPYIADMVNTKGHVAGLTGGGWAPHNPDLVWTSSLDGSVRFWNLAGTTVFDELLCGDVIKLRNPTRPRVGATAAGMSPDGKVIVAAGDDGSLQLFNVRSPGHRYVRADATVKAAHAPGATTCVCFAPDGVRFATRGAGDVLKIWDVRKLSSSSSGGGHLAEIGDVAAQGEAANVAWSPDGALLLAGCAVRKGQGDGRLLVFNVASAEAAGGARLGAAPSSSLSGGSGLDGPSAAAVSLAVARGVSAVCVQWHERINQVAVGCGDGSTHVLFDPEHSTKGALMSIARAPKRRDLAVDDTVSVSASAMDIIAPNALPMYRDERLPKKMRYSELQAARLTDPRRIPALPLDEPEFVHKGNRTFTQYFMGTQAAAREPGGGIREQDPTEVLRAYAQRAAEPEGAVYTRAYAESQPKPTLAAKTIEQEEEENEEELSRLLGTKGASSTGGR